MNLTEVCERELVDLGFSFDWSLFTCMLNLLECVLLMVLLGVQSG
jgi:hypothetical protein